MLYGLGIKEIGTKTAKLLASEFSTMDMLIGATREELESIRDIGSITAKSVVEYFATHKDLIEELKHIGINMTYKGRIAGTNELVTDKKFVITGTITGWGRNEIKDKLESFNAKVSGSVSKNTDIVIVGANPGSKYQDALNLGITIWDEAKTLEVLNNLQ